ncbi:unnamed protein product [Pleuronectes platessa]|uniref:Uncharacterized protein n=1 Tax=Pleuronectes platessa TaxID=8262 RepID=A0A9N7VTV1_PLEPL|nr:unnamed protein product [Pleuronectes platessa]
MNVDPLTNRALLRIPAPRRAPSAQTHALPAGVALQSGILCGTIDRQLLRSREHRECDTLTDPCREGSLAMV